MSGLSASHAGDKKANRFCCVSPENDSCASSFASRLFTGLPVPFASHCVDHCERLRGEHGYFVDDEDASIADATDDISVLPNSVKIVVCEIAPHPNPAP